MSLSYPKKKLPLLQCCHSKKSQRYRRRSLSPALNLRNLVKFALFPVDREAPIRRNIATTEAGNPDTTKLLNTDDHLGFLNSTRCRVNVHPFRNIDTIQRTQDIPGTNMTNSFIICLQVGLTQHCNHDGKRNKVYFSRRILII